MARFLVCSSMLLLAALITGCSNETDSSSDRQSAKKNGQEHKQSPSDADKKQPRSETGPSASNERQLSGGSQTQGSAESSPVESIDLAYLPDGYCAAFVLHPSRLLDHPAVSPDMRGVVASAINDGLDEFLPMSEILPDVNSLEQAIVMADAQLLEMLLREAGRSRYDDKEIEYDKKEVSNGELREFEEKSVETPEIDRQNDERGEGVRIDESDKIEINSNANGVPELDLPELPDVNPPRLDIRPDADDSSFTPQDASTRYVAFLGAEEAGENENVVKQLVDRARASRTEWDRASRSVDDLQMIILGVHNYHDANRGLPPAFSVDKEGKPLLSWRVHLLPYIEQQSLYDQFKLDEPRDSEHNIKLLEQMPEIYRTSDSPTKTSLMMVVAGEGTAYEGKMGLRFHCFRDGLSNTILVVRAGTDKAVPWTKPEDLPFNPDDPVAAFGKTEDNGLMVLMGDGRVHQLPRNIAPETLRALLTRASGDEASLSGRTTEAFDVSGTVTLDGKPLSGGRIVFTNNEVEAFTSINPDGTYNLRGLAAGAYAVYFAEPDDKDESGSTLSAIPSKYCSPESSALRIEVSGETSFDIVLESR